MDKPEVLVHISTPATRANDDLFRSLADAYLEFEPRQGHKSQKDVITGATPSQAGHVPEAQDHTSSEPQVPDSDNAPPIIRSMDSYGSFPSYITSGDQSSDQLGSGATEVLSSPEDVSISRLEQLERIQAKWKQQKPPRSSLGGNTKQNDISVVSAETSSFLEDTQQAFADIASQLSDELSTTSEEEEFLLENEATPDASEMTETGVGRDPFMPSSGNTQAEPRASTSAPTPKDMPPSAQSVEKPTRQSARSTKTFRASSIDSDRPDMRRSTRLAPIEHRAGSQVPPAPSQQSSAESRKDDASSLLDGKASLTVDFQDLAVTVTPPSAHVSIESPGTLPSQVTPYLEGLKQKDPARFKAKLSRILQADERGHWRVDCRLWPKHIQLGFWSSLQDDVQSGRLGWGVTLHRDATRMKLGLVRLYCWGEIVEHTWLSLWQHSGGRIWSTGAVWVDASEVEIVTIP